MRKLVDLIIFKNLINLDKLYTYETEIDLNPGDFVMVDFNNKLEIALVLKSYESESDLDLKKVMMKIKDLKPLDKTHIELGLWMKEFYILTYAKAFKTISDFTKIDNKYLKYKSVKNIDEKFEKLIERYNDGLAINEKDALTMKSLESSGKIERTGDYKLVKTDPIKYYQLSYTLDESLEEVRKNANRQIDLLKDLFNLEDKLGFLSLEDIKDLKSYEKSVLDDLLEKNLIVEIDRPKFNIESDISLTKKQKEIVDDICNSENNKFLIHGVTGSGKTEIYFDLIEKYIKSGKTAIFLVPEIGLTPQMEMRARKRFGDLISVIHSKLSKKKRVTEIERIESGEAKIILGTRSAIFSNIPNLGLIIVDEEHDDSYKLNRYNKYDIREVARFLIEKTPNSKLVLGSATPSIESYFKAINGVYKLYSLKERPLDMVMPEVIVADMREELKMGNKTAFSFDLLASMKNSLMREKQVLLFLNRRGFSTFVNCRDCGYTVKCEKCDISMVYHKHNNYLKCHYCNDIKPMPKRCPSCGSPNIKQFGMGTEKLEELTKKNFPDFDVIRIDSDTTSKPEKYRKNVEQILNNEIDIIVGTQMITKGLDFPNIDTVGVMASDLTLNVPEYDASEKTFQQISQVAGRSGRSEDRGTVIVQTYNPDHYSIRHAKNHDFESFFKEELMIRKAFSYPPFSRQYIITIMNPIYEEALYVSQNYYKALEEEIMNNRLKDSVDFVSHKDRLSVSKLNNRFHVKIILTSNIRHEQNVKKSIYNVFIGNKYNIKSDLTHIDVVTR